jgi:hypothetical protein
MPNQNFKTALTVRQTENEIFSDPNLWFGKAVRVGLTRRQMRIKIGRWRILYSLVNPNRHNIPRIVQRTV